MRKNQQPRSERKKPGPKPKVQPQVEKVERPVMGELGILNSTWDNIHAAGFTDAKALNAATGAQLEAIEGVDASVIAILRAEYGGLVEAVQDDTPEEADISEEPVASPEPDSLADKTEDIAQDDGAAPTDNEALETLARMADEDGKPEIAEQARKAIEAEPVPAPQSFAVDRSRKEGVFNNGKHRVKAIPLEGGAWWCTPDSYGGEPYRAVDEDGIYKGMPA